MLLLHCAFPGVQPVCQPHWAENLGWKFYFVYIAVLVIQCLMIYFYYVETRGLPLEEIARVIHGENAAAAMVADSLAEQMPAPYRSQSRQPAGEGKV